MFFSELAPHPYNEETAKNQLMIETEREWKVVLQNRGSDWSTLYD